MKFMLLTMPRIHRSAKPAPMGPAMSMGSPPNGLVIRSGVAPRRMAATATKTWPASW